MKKNILASFSVLALLLCGIPLVNKEPAVEAHAVSTTRLYVVINADIVARAPAYKLYNGASDVVLTLLSTEDTRHTGDIYTYFTDSPGTGWKTLKNNGGDSINLYNIDPAGYGSTWDTITFNSPISNWSTPASVVKSIYTPPVVGEQYDVSLYNGASLVATQTASEGVAYTPQPVTVNDYIFEGWYVDSALTTAYVPTVLTADTSLYGKFTAIDLDKSTRLYIASNYTWWYDGGARIDIYFWKNGVTAQVLTMRKEVGNLHSVVLPNASYTKIKLERKNPVSPYNVWNATGDITVNLTTYPVIKLNGNLDGGYTGPMAVTDFSNTAPDIAYLKTEVPLLTCTNYDEANGLLGAYNRLGDNELEIIDALTTPSHDEVPLTYKSKIDYYVSYAATQAPASPRASLIAKTNGSFALTMMLGLSSFATVAFYLIKKKKTISE